MKKALKILVVLFLVFIVGPIVYSAFDPYIAWYFADYHAHLTVDGKAARGWVHRDRGGRSLFVTRCDGEKPRTYLIELPSQASAHALSCGGWVAPRFPVFATGDLSPPCWTLSSSGGPNPTAVHPPTNLVTGHNFVEFTAYDGKRVRATW